MPLQWLWAALDVATIIVLGSGLYLWIGKRSAARKVEPKAALAAALRARRQETSR